MPHHLLNEDAITSRGVLYKHMRHSSYQFTVLNYRTSAQECVNMVANTFSS